MAAEGAVMSGRSSGRRERCAGWAGGVVMRSLQSAVLQREAAQRDRWRAEITIDGVPDTEFISPIYGLSACPGRI